MDAESESLESPPSPSRTALRQSARNRLFDDSCDDNSDAFSFMQDQDRNNGRTPMRGSFGGGKKLVKPLNLSFDDESSDDDDDGPSLSLQRRKRLGKLAESGRRDSQSHTPTRASGASDMVSSPYISPSSYIVTMDGRCVQSKNPFSPMVTDDISAISTAAGINGKVVNTSGEAPSLPVSFEGGSTSRLQKRYASFTRDGYPEKFGRYSFTGSPIKENESKPQNNNKIEMYDSASPSMMTAHKIRRLGLSNDVHYPNNSERRNITVDTSLPLSTTKSSFEEVSPTDIFSFPTPPTPQKAKSPLSNPETPFISRSGRRPTRRRAADHDSSDMESITTCASYQSEEDGAVTASRFKSDFDIIGELGKGSFGAVYKVLSRLDGCMYAIKAALRKAKGNADRDRMLKEVRKYHSKRRNCYE